MTTTMTETDFVACPNCSEPERVTPREARNGGRCYSCETREQKGRVIYKWADTVHWATPVGTIGLPYKRTSFVQVTEPLRPDSHNFRIVSHHGNRSWSAYATFEGIQEQMTGVERDHATKDCGFFLVLEGG